MRRTLPTRGLKTILLTSAIALVVAGCTDESPGPPSAQQTPAAAASESVPEPVEAVEPAEPVAPVVDKLPVDVAPEVPGGRTAWQECPYLDTQWVADTNGQRVTGVGVDERFSTPACVFWSYPEEPQLTVIVREMDTIDEAIAVVDWAAPVETTELAEEPAGWSGGRLGGTGGSGALYAVQKDTVAVVVFTNQDQSLKAQLVAETVIDNLGL